MGLTNAGRTDGATRLDAGPDAGGTDSRIVLDQATRARVQLVCDFVNAEIMKWRGQLVAVGAACLVGMVLLPIITKIVDVRVAFVIVVGIMWFWFVRARRELASSYRSIATKRLVTATNKALTYKPVSSLTRDLFASLDLFPAPGNGYQSRHEIGGKVSNATFSFHAVHAPSTDRGPVLFRGVIIRLEFSTSFPGHTVVFPEHQGQAIGGSAGSHAKRDLVLMKNPEFEQMFSAYATDYSQARRLFTAELTQLLMAAAETVGPDIRLAFVRRSLFIAVPNATLLPEVGLLGATLTPEGAAGQVVRLVTFADAIAKAVASSQELPIV